MSITKLFARIALTAAAVFAWADGSAFAADVTPPPPPVVSSAAPVTAGAPGCESCATCQHGVAAKSCTKCGKWFTGFKNHKDPYPVNLCPGACFGYFQTQWRKWDEVCPYPYTGIGASDAPRLPGTVNPKGELAPPRPLDPKVMPDPKKVGSDVVPIPMPGKFGP